MKNGISWMSTKYIYCILHVTYLLYYWSLWTLAIHLNKMAVLVIQYIIIFKYLCKYYKYMLIILVLIIIPAPLTILIQYSLNNTTYRQHSHSSPQYLAITTSTPLLHLLYIIATPPLHHHYIIPTTTIHLLKQTYTIPTPMYVNPYKITTPHHKSSYATT